MWEKGSALAVPREVRFPNKIKAIIGLPPRNPPIDRKRLSARMANRLRTDSGTKNPGSLAGDTGAPKGSARRLEQKKSYSIPAPLSSAPAFRAVMVAGRFVCLERQPPRSVRLP